MSTKNIIVKGARVHNLKNVNVEIPKDKLTVITGLSGSGKSSLAFDCIYAEGQRRYVESLSAYARQFLGLMDKPDVDSIEGLSPAISIEQKTTSKNPRSTVGTVTEIYDYLRLLFARIGELHCPKCNTKIKPQSTENIINLIVSQKGKRLVILAPIVRGLKGTYEAIFDDLKKEGFSRVRVDGKLYHLDTVKDEIKLERYEKHWIEAVIDRVVVSDDERLRIADAVEQAINFGKGRVLIVDVDEEKKLLEENKNAKKEMQRGFGEQSFSTFGACPNHPEVVFEPLEPRMFSFNSPFGACSECFGIGEKLECDPNLIIPDKNLSIMDGAIAVYGKMDGWRMQQIQAVGKQYGFDLFMPISEFSQYQLDVLLYGTTRKIKAFWSNGAKMNLNNGWEGVITQTERLLRQTDSEWRRNELSKFMRAQPCNVCRGKRLKENVLAVKVDGKSIIDITDMNVGKAVKFFKELEPKLSEKETIIAKQVLKEINERYSFLNNVGLNYLDLSRAARTLSGGEAQRIRLATQIGSQLTGVLYVLDEPSIGLH
ncbi:MAG: excinuclease ABC subunit UvrA, partial [Nanoarchaeota archaeon]